MVPHLADIELRDPHRGHVRCDGVQEIMRHEMRKPGPLDQLSEGPGHVRLRHGTTARRARKNPFGIEREFFHLLDDREHGRRQRNPIGPFGLGQLGWDVPPAIAPVEIRPAHAGDFIPAL